LSKVASETSVTRASASATSASPGSGTLRSAPDPAWQTTTPRRFVVILRMTTKPVSTTRNATPLNASTPFELPAGSCRISAAENSAAASGTTSVS